MESAFKVQGGKIVREIERAAPATIADLAAVPTSILSDCLDRFQVVHGLRPLLPPRSFAGSAFTVEEMEGGNLMSHLALQYIHAGDVLVIDGKGITTRACWGGLQTLAARRKGVTAIIIDGAVRDFDDVLRCDVPVYCRALTPAGPHKGWGGRINQPISLGGTVVHPGDVIVGDSDGLVVAPRALAEALVDKCRKRMAMEKEWFEQVEAGSNTADFLGFAALAKSYNIEIV